MRPANRFVQLVTSPSSLTALSDDGKVWIYLGNEYGWAPLNMKRLSVSESKSVRAKKIEERENKSYEEEE